MNTLKIELPKRFMDAITKLYNAFHSGELYALDDCYCAVGNLCNNKGDWSDVLRGQRNLLGEAQIKNTGYSISEISDIESIFMYGCTKKEKYYTSTQYTFEDERSKETQFIGLCAVIEYLCELDNIPNIMEYKSLFETENKRELSEVI